jgi:hypothetical protein
MRFGTWTVNSLHRSRSLTAVVRELARYKLDLVAVQGRRKGPKKGSNGKFHNARPVGRPKIKWEDAVQKDALQILGTRGWRRRAENREEWRHLLR